jgi:hypothetical protein
MIAIDKFLQIIKKHGATGVLALWLFYTHNEVQDLKIRLYACYGKNNTTATKSINDSYTFAVIPKDELTNKLKRLRIWVTNG